MHSYPLHGGLRLAIDPNETSAPIRVLPPPLQLTVSLRQGRGPPALACVQPGQKVRRGERIGRAYGGGVDVHAPISGIVSAVESHALPSANGREVAAVSIESGGKDELQYRPPLNPEIATPEELRERLRSTGVTGCEMAAGREVVPLLILNAVDCIPCPMVNSALLCERAEAVVRGGMALARALEATRVVLALAETMTQAKAAVQAVLAKHGHGAIELISRPAIYSANHPRLLIRQLTGRDLPNDERPGAIGIAIESAATAAAAWHAITEGAAVTSHLVAVTGTGLARPGVFEVRLGTPLADVIAAAGGCREIGARLCAGGSLAGAILCDDNYPVTRLYDAAQVLSAEEVRDAPPAVPCIDCGACAEICPVKLQPRQLHRFIAEENWMRAYEYRLFDCIECGGCDAVCPSHIPLLERYRQAKAQLALQERRAMARARFQNRQARLAHEAAEREARRAQTVVRADAVRTALERASAMRAKSPAPEDDR